MKIYVLFGQQSDTETYAPEALEVINEYDDGDNPEWIENKLEDARKNGIWARLEIVEIELHDKALNSIMKPHHSISGEIKTK